VGILRERKVEVGGRRLHVVEGGRGSPVVVLEAGFGCSSELWRDVQERVSVVTASYSYDRADHGASDPAGPWTLEVWRADLEAWLAALAVDPPYVLVGHSFGGHIIRAFAARHPGEVAGMVLIDARHERLAETLPEWIARLRELAAYDAEQGLRADEVITRLTTEAGRDDLARMPLTVITHGRAGWIPAEFGFGQAERDHCERAWQALQHDLAARAPNSVLRVAATSGHLIPAEQPDLVAEEILALVARHPGTA
jgi:pimeloyl-ACP methyl ester carboxylesterase